MQPDIWISAPEFSTV